MGEAVLALWPWSPPPRVLRPGKGCFLPGSLGFRLWPRPASTWPGNPHVPGLSLPRPVQKSHRGAWTRICCSSDLGQSCCLRHDFTRMPKDSYHYH